MINLVDKETFDPDAFKRFFSKQMGRYSIPGASLSISINEHEYTFTDGVTDLRNRDPVTPKTLFQIGSITKMFTSTLIMQEVEAGNINLDDSLVSHLDTLRLDKASYPEQIFIRHLLSHCTGHSGDFFLDPPTHCGRQIKLIDLFDELTALWAPGRVFSYCNAAFVLLGSVLEKITGQTWDELVATRIFDPLGMIYSVTETHELANHSVAVGHNFDGTRLVNEPVAEPFLAFSNKAAGSTLSASSADLVSFGTSFTRSRLQSATSTILSPTSIGKMMSMETPVTPGSFRDVSGFGLGCMIFEEGEQTFFGHNGSTPGQEAFLRIDPERDFVFGLLTNGGDRYGFFRTLLNCVAQKMLGTEIRETIDWKYENSYAPSKYVGKYEDFSFCAEIYIHENGLRVKYKKKWEFVWPIESFDLQIRSTNNELFVAELPGQSNPLTLLFRWIDVTHDQNPDGIQISGRCLKRKAL